MIEMILSTFVLILVVVGVVGTIFIHHVHEDEALIDIRKKNSEIQRAGWYVRVPGLKPCAKIALETFCPEWRVLEASSVDRAILDKWDKEQKLRQTACSEHCIRKSFLVFGLLLILHGAMGLIEGRIFPNTRHADKIVTGKSAIVYSLDSLVLGVILVCSNTRRDLKSLLQYWCQK